MCKLRNVRPLRPHHRLCNSAKVLVRATFFIRAGAKSFYPLAESEYRSTTLPTVSTYYRPRRRFPAPKQEVQ